MTPSALVPGNLEIPGFFPATIREIYGDDLGIVPVKTTGISGCGKIEQVPAFPVGVSGKSKIPDRKNGEICNDEPTNICPKCFFCTAVSVVKNGEVALFKKALFDAQH